MNTKKILAMVIALAMIVAIVPTFGLVASAADGPANVTFEEFNNLGGQNKADYKKFNPATGEITVEFDLTYIAENGIASNNDFIGLGSSAINDGNPTFGNSAIGMHSVASEGFQFNNAGTQDPTTRFQMDMEVPYHVTITTDTVAKTYSAMVENDLGEIVSEATNFGYRNGNTEFLDTFMALNNGGGAANTFTISNLSIWWETAAENAKVTVKYSNGDEITVDDSVYVGDTYTVSGLPQYYIAEDMLYTVGAVEPVEIDKAEVEIIVPLTAYRKVVSENLAVNGDLETGDFTNWTTEAGEAVDEEKIQIVEEGENYVISTAAATNGDDNQSIKTSVTAPAAADYYVAIDAKGNGGNNKGARQYMWFAVDGTPIGADQYMDMNSNEYTTTAEIAENVAEGAEIAFIGKWFQDAHPYIDNFVVYQLALLEGQEKVTVDVNYVADGVVVGKQGTVTGVVGETVNVPASTAVINGTDGNKYYVAAAVTATIEADKAIEVPVKALTVYTIQGAGVWTANAEDAGNYKGDEVFGAYNWNATGFDRIGVAVVDLPEAFAAEGSYAVTADNYRRHFNAGAVTQVWAISVDDYKALNMTVEAVGATKTDDNTIFNGEVLNNIIPVDAAKLAAVAGDADQVVLLGTTNGGLYGLTNDIRIVPAEVSELAAPVLGWNGTAFTINFLFGEGLTPNTVNIYANDAAEDAAPVARNITDKTEGNNYGVVSINGVALTTADSNRQYQAKAVIGAAESKATAPTSIYKLVVEAIAAAELDGEIEATQLAAANAVLAAGGIYLDNGELTAEAKLVMTKTGNTLTLTEAAYAAGLRFTDGTVATGGTLTANEDGTATITSAEGEEFVVYLEDVEFVLEAAEVVADEAVSGELDFVEEV